MAAILDPPPRSFEFSQNFSAEIEKKVNKKLRNTNLR